MANTELTMMAPQLLRLLPTPSGRTTGGQGATRAIRHPAVAARAARVVRQLPWVEVPLTSRPGGAAIRHRLERRAWVIPTGRLARTTLAIPDDPADYLRGRHRQAVRTNITRAKRSGVTSREISGRDVGELAHAVDAGHWRDHLTWVARSVTSTDEDSTLCVVAHGADGAPLAVAAAITDERVAQLTVHVSDPDREDARDARYVLTYELVQSLARRQVQLLLGESALSTSRGLAYFQHLQGFSPANLRLRDLI